MKGSMPDVLIVDDDPDIREMLAFTLSGHGFTTRQAGNGIEALHQLRVASPDCLVLDLMMPGLDGFDVLATRRAEGIAVDAKVLVLSCRGDEAAFVRAWELGADEYLVKPTDPDVLVARIRELSATPAAG
jgi:DNA-binding response OmpR family regulator